MKIRFKKLDPGAVLPKHAKPGDAGADLTVVEIIMANIERTQERHHYGLAVEIPEEHVGLLFPRSSIHKANVRLSNCVGVLDSGYRGEVMAVFDRERTAIGEYNPGDRSAQLIIVPYRIIDAEWAEELSETERGAGGYGHTGLK